MVRPSRHTWLCLLLGLALAGCPRRPPSIDADAGLAPDAPLDVDTDGDGLCDPREVGRGTRIDLADTDDDGYSDLAEVSLGFDPLLPASPDRDGILVLEEREGATARTTMVATVSGMGETYSGAFSSARQAVEDGASATDFFDGAAAIGAEPMPNVFAIEGERVLGVRGRTQLVYEIRFAFDGEPTGCARAYPFVYQVKRDDGRIVGQRRLTLVIRPPGDADWCGVAPCF